MAERSNFDLLITEGTAITPSLTIPDAAVAIRGSSISFVGRRPAFLGKATDTLSAKGGWIVPGLIDLHVHGVGGRDVAFDLAGVSRTLARHGVTAFLPTLIPKPLNQMVGTVARLASAVTPAMPGAVPLGLHLEGPCLSPRQSGCLDPDYFLLPQDRAVTQLIDAAGPGLRRMTLAVELPGAEDLMRLLVSRGVVLSLGHTAADFEEVVQAVRLGLRQATHTFNAMKGFHHRAPGPVAAVMLCGDVVAEVIADGEHVHAGALELLYRTKGPSGVMLASDVSPAAGLESDTADWAGRRGAWRTADGRLAGSASLLDDALRLVANDTAIPVAHAVAMASLVPARAIGVADHKGSLEPGKDADIAVFDGQWKCLATVIGGKLAEEHFNH